MQTVKLSSKNQIVIPKEAREAMRIKKGDELLVVTKDNITIIMQKPASYCEALSGLGKGIYKKDYLKKERRSW
ncbi:MAG: AbrB/MazE/SpoVT family DNA-binding domain-containing protein [Nitrospirae bacterium]|nr:AbrB/MazE/SpoVT family DNA-binding domain-containing protein [Nitrospirota bacterium]